MKRICFFSILAYTAMAFADPQVQQVWVQRYALTTAGTNQTVAIALASDNGVIVAGSSTSTNGDFDYTLIKYSPDGQPIWTTRYDSPGHGSDQLRGMVLDNNGCPIVTGTTDTVKFDQTSNVLWSAPYGGKAVVFHDTNIYVTGFSELDWATVALSVATGTNVWVAYHDNSWGGE